MALGVKDAPRLSFFLFENKTGHQGAGRGDSAARALLERAAFQAPVNSRSCGTSARSHGQGALRASQLHTVFRLQHWRGILSSDPQEWPCLALLSRSLSVRL